MKNLYAKGKVRIHPHSPTDDLSVLALLPAAILSMTAVLSDEDKEVLAYLVTRSLNGAEADRQWLCRTSRQQQQHGPPAAGGVHRPMFDCGCFECYMRFWIRWDSSPDRELIHQVIEAFEEHLAVSEKKGKGGRRRRRERKEKGRKKEVEARKEDGVEVEEEEEEEEEKAVKKEGREVVEAVEMDSVLLTVEEEEVVGDESHEPAAGADGGGGERRRSWPDMMGLFSSRLWNLWSPST